MCWRWSDRLLWGPPRKLSIPSRTRARRRVAPVMRPCTNVTHACSPGPSPRRFNGLQAFMLALQGQRPAIRLPSSLASLKKLIEQCWHADGSQRPTMAQNAVTLDAIFTLAQAQGSSFKAQSLASLPEQNGAAQV